MKECTFGSDKGVLPSQVGYFRGTRPLPCSHGGHDLKPKSKARAVYTRRGGGRASVERLPKDFRGPGAFRGGFPSGFNVQKLRGDLGGRLLKLCRLKRKIAVTDAARSRRGLSRRVVDPELVGVYLFLRTPLKLDDY